GTLLFDVANRRWSEEVLAALELPGEWLPTVHESPAIAGAGDQAAAALGVGVVSGGAVSVVLGTSGVVFGTLDRYRPDAQARVHVFCHAVPSTWHAMGVMLSAAGSLQWMRDTFAPGIPFEALVEAAARAASCGGGSSRRCSACRSSARRLRRDRPSAPRSSPASTTRARPSNAASVSETVSIRTPSGPASTRKATSGSASSIPSSAD